MPGTFANRTGLAKETPAGQKTFTTLQKQIITRLLCRQLAPLPTFDREAGYFYELILGRRAAMPDQLRSGF